MLDAARLTRYSAVRMFKSGPEQAMIAAHKAKWLAKAWARMRGKIDYFKPSSFIASRANEKSLTSSSGRFFSTDTLDDRVDLGVGHGAVAGQGLEFGVVGMLGDVEGLGQPLDQRLNRILAVL